MLSKIARNSPNRRTKIFAAKRFQNSPDFRNLCSAMSFSRTSNILNFNTVYLYRIALLTLGTLDCSCVCMVAQLHALSVQQSKHLLSVEFSKREHWTGTTEILRTGRTLGTPELGQPKCITALDTYGQDVRFTGVTKFDITNASFRTSY